MHWSCNNKLSLLSFYRIVYNIFFFEQHFLKSIRVVLVFDSISVIKCSLVAQTPFLTTTSITRKKTILKAKIKYKTD